MIATAIIMGTLWVVSVCTFKWVHEEKYQSVRMTFKSKRRELRKGWETVSRWEVRRWFAYKVSLEVWMVYAWMPLIVPALALVLVLSPILLIVVMYLQEKQYRKEKQRKREREEEWQAFLARSRAA